MVFRLQSVDLSLQLSVFSSRRLVSGKLNNLNPKKINISFGYWMLSIKFAPQYCGVEQW